MLRRMAPPVLEMHLVVPRLGEGLLLQDARAGRLPCVRPPIGEDETLVKALERHLRDAWDLEPVILETYLPDSSGEGPLEGLAVLEPPPAEWSPPADVGWATGSPAAPEPVAGRAATWIDEWRQETAPPVLRARWSRPGWQRRARAWIDDALAASGRRRTGRSDMQRLWTLTALMRVPTDRGPAWFKGVFPHFGHEPAVTRALARLAPSVMPTVLATEDAEGWLLTDDVPGTELGMSTDPASITGAVRALVDVQRAAVDLHDELRTLGVPDRPLRHLASQLREAVAAAPGVGGRSVEPGRLDRVVEWVADRSAWLDGLGFRDVVVHGDFNRANTLVTPAGLVVIDWSDAAIGNPLMDVAVWMVHPGGRFGPDDPSWPAWMDALDGLGDTGALRDEYATVFGLGAAYQVVSYVDIARAIEPAMRYQVSDGIDDFWGLLDEAVPA